MQSAYLSTQAENGPSTPYLVHLLLDQAVPTDRDIIMARLAARLGRVEPAQTEGAMLHFFLPDYPSQLGDQVVPLQLALLALDGISVDELAAALRQSWTWPDAGEVAAHCRASLTVSDFYGAGIDRRIRLALFHGAVSAMLETLPVRAVQWLPSQQVVAPGDYLARLTSGEGLVGSAINVRRFKVPTAGGTAQLFDTVGMGAFGLPDLQLRFEGLESEIAAQWLYAQATALFEEGDHFLTRGELKSTDGSELWGFRQESASAAPSRRVLDIGAGSFAPAG